MNVVTATSPAIVLCLQNGSRKQNGGGQQRTKGEVSFTSREVTKAYLISHIVIESSCLIVLYIAQLNTIRESWGCSAFAREGFEETTKVINYATPKFAAPSIHAAPKPCITKI